MSPADKRTEILLSALEVFSSNGFHGAPIAMIADRSQVAQGTIYRYFESKETLIFELHRFLVEKFEEAQRRDIPQGRPLRERFFHVGRGFVRYCLGAPLDFRFLEQFHNSPYGVVYRRDLIFGNKNGGVIHELLEEGQRERILKVLPPSVHCALIFGPILCLVRDQILGFTQLDQQLIEHAIEACWDAIRA